MCNDIVGRVPDFLSNDEPNSNFAKLLVCAIDNTVNYQNLDTATRSLVDWYLTYMYIDTAGIAEVIGKENKIVAMEMAISNIRNNNNV